MDDNREDPNADTHSGKEEPLTPVVVTWTGSLYRIVDPELAITVEDADLAEGYAKFRQLRAEVLRGLSDAGVPPPSRPDASANAKGAAPRTVPFTPNGGESRRSELRRYMFQFLIVGFAIILGYQLLVAPVLQRIDRAVALVQEADPYAHTRDASRALARFADLVQQITPERRKELRENLRIIVRELRPLTLELVPLFDPAAPLPVAGDEAAGAAAEPASPGRAQPVPARAAQP